MTANENEMEQHEAHVRIIMEAVSGLVPQFTARGLTPVAAFEGAVKGASVAMMALNDCSPAEVADLLEEMADHLRREDGAGLRVMQ